MLVRSASARHRLLPHLSQGNRAKTAAAPLTAILATDTAFHEHLPRIFPHRPGLRDRLDADPAGREAQARFNAALQIGHPGPDAWTDRLPRLTHDDVVHTV